MATAPDSAPPRRDPSPADALGGLNAKTLKRQRLILGTGGALLLCGAGYWILGPSGDGHAKPGGTDKAQIQVSTDDMVNKTVDQKVWMAMSGNRLNGQDERIKQLEGKGQNLDQLQAQVAQLQQQNQEMKTDGQRVIDAYDQENQRLKSGAAGGTAGASAGANGEPFPPAGGQPPIYGSAGGYNAQGMAPGPDGQPAPMTPAEVKIISFNGSGKEEGGAGTGGGARSARPDAEPVVVEDSPEYLPPNSYAPAKVIVGVDASAGVSSQTDPLPVVLRITGPARSVVQNGRVLTTKIEGCIINGAARGDLSSEKVYVKLAKMTCDQPGGRVAVSDVKGFISFGGKTGVRGRVVSREGALVGQALVAGIAAGFGRGFSANADAALSGVQVNTSGKIPQLGAADIVKGGLGNGVATAGDEVSKYLIERAEQYQPVIEMPTGIDVEIVFLDGAYVRTSR